MNRDPRDIRQEARIAETEACSRCARLVNKIVDDLNEALDEVEAGEHLVDKAKKRDADGPVLAAGSWATNAELIADVHRLGYLEDDDVVLDATYGKGTWWKVWRPDGLVTNDIDPAADAECRDDFRHLSCTDDTWDVVAYDPPYVSVGGRETSGMKEMHQRYGMTDAPTSPLDLQRLIDDGLTEMYRVVKPKGIVLVKCQDYISSGKLWGGTHMTLGHAMWLGFDLLDKLEMVTHPRPQPPGRRQVHARRNLSTLFVLRKPTKRSTGGR